MLETYILVVHLGANFLTDVGCDEWYGCYDFIDHGMEAMLHSCKFYYGDKLTFKLLWNTQLTI